MSRIALTPARIALLCARLIPGADGLGQPASVRTALRHLEAHGYAEFRGGWDLTAEGRKAAAGAAGKYTAELVRTK